MGCHKKLILAASIIAFIPLVCAQSPAGHDDRAVTMRVLDPDVSESGDVVRKFPRAKPKRTAAPDSRTRADLASPRRSGSGNLQQGGSGVDPGRPADTTSPDPVSPDPTTAVPGSPSDPIIISEPGTTAAPPGPLDPMIPADPARPEHPRGPDFNGAPGPGGGLDPRDRAEDFGRQVSDDARNRVEEPRRHADSPGPPGDRPPREDPPPRNDPPREPPPPRNEPRPPRDDPPPPRNEPRPPRGDPPPPRNEPRPPRGPPDGPGNRPPERPPGPPDRPPREPRPDRQID